MDASLLKTTLFGTAAAGFFACFGKIKAVIDRIIGLFIIDVCLTYTSAEIMNAYLMNNARKVQWGPRYYICFKDVLKTTQKRQFFPAETLTGSATFFILNRRLVWLTGLDKQDHVSDASSNIKISFFRGTFKPEQLIIQATDYYNNRVQQIGTRFKVIQFTGEGSIHARGGNNEGNGAEPPGRAHYAFDEDPDHNRKVYEGIFKLIGQHEIKDIGMHTVTENPFDVFIYDQKIHDAIKEILFWRDNEKWFKNRNIPWRRGWLLHGKPGTGKTTLIRCIGQYLDLPVITFDIASMSNAEFDGYWSSLSKYTPCIALIEDIDRTYHLDKNIIGEQGGGLSFDRILNCLSGIKICDGVFTVVTTNNIELIDPALGVVSASGFSTRPGRLDRVIEIEAPASIARHKIAGRILSDFPEEVDKIVHLGSVDSAAEFQDRCCTKALELFWNKFDSNKKTVV